MGLIDHVKGEWTTLKGAPVVFGILAVLAFTAGFGGGLFFKDQQVAALEALMRLKDGELDSYRKGIEERLGAVEKQLSTAQIESMIKELTSAPSEVLFWNSPGEVGDLGKEIRSVFSGSGWDVSPYLFAKAPPTSSKPIFLAIPANESGRSLKAAFDAAGLAYDYKTVDTGPAEVWVNPDQP